MSIAKQMPHTKYRLPGRHQKMKEEFILAYLKHLLKTDIVIMLGILTMRYTKTRMNFSNVWDLKRNHKEPHIT